MTSDYQSGADAMRRFRHKKRGTTYKVIGVGQIQSDVPLTDSEYVVIYQSEADWHFWARRMSEFEDGRFEEIPDNPERFASFHRLIDALDDAGILPADPASSEGENAREDALYLDDLKRRLSDAFSERDQALEGLTKLNTAILARDAEIATMRAALDPFADCVNEGWAPDELKDDDVVMLRVKHHQGYTLKVSDFRRAAAIKQAEGK